MKLYHYIAKNSNVWQKGLLSFAANPQADISYYVKRSQKNTHSEIVKWMEDCFVGRSRGIRAFSEPIKWTEHSLKTLKEFVDKSERISIDISALSRDGLLEKVYVSPPVTDVPELSRQNPNDEILLEIKGIDEIDFSPVDWSICNDELGYRFAFVRYYMLIIKDGVIPPEYLQKD